MDDLLIAGEPAVAREAALMISRTWKCTEPQWDDVSFNGFEISRTEEGMILGQDSYTKDLLARYKDLDGYEEVPAPTQTTSEDLEIRDEENFATYVKAAQTMAGELQWLAGRCRPEILYAVNLLSQAISKNPKEAVFRGAHLLRYLKRYPEAGIFYATKAQVTPDAQVSSSKAVVEGFCDASFAPNSGRSQQAIMIFVMGGLVAWASHRQAFVTMSTAESELVAICELTTCMKSVEHLVAEVFLHDLRRVGEVTKVIYSDSQAALAVCRSAAGSWRTRHLRIRGNMIRELLEDPSWAALHVDGKVMPADLGTKALSAERFGFLVDRMRVVRRRQNHVARATNPEQVRRLITLLCVALLVERGEAAEQEDRMLPDYMFAGACVVAVIAIWECFKSVLAWLMRCCGSTGLSQRAEERTRSVAHTSDLGSSDSLGDSSLEPTGPRLRTSRRPTTTRTFQERAVEPVCDDWPPLDVHGYIPSGGKRDFWVVDERSRIAIRHHPTPRLNLFVPGQAAGGPPMNRFTGERRTIGRLNNGEIRVHCDDFTALSKPAQLLANCEWKGQTELRLK